jgi:hypothetical protein
MVNNSLVNAKGSETSMFYVNQPNAKPAMTDLQHVLYVPSCSMNNLLSMIQLMWKEVNFDFNLDGAMARLESVCV